METARAKASADGYADLARLSAHSGLGRRTLRDAIHDPADPLPAYRLGGGKFIVRLTEFDAWLARRRYVPQTVDEIVEDVLRDVFGDAR
jgi:hypothetical protein